MVGRAIYPCLMVGNLSAFLQGCVILIHTFRFENITFLLSFSFRVSRQV